MVNILEYILPLKDQMSSNLQKIGVNSDSALNKFAGLEKQSKETAQPMKDFGGSVGALRENSDTCYTPKGFPKTIFRPSTPTKAK